MRLPKNADGKLANHIFLLILAFFAVFYLFISFSIPITGDGSFHAGTVEAMYQQGKALDQHPYNVTDGHEHLPILYPKLFYIESVVQRNFIGSAVYYVQTPLFGIFIGLFVFLFTRALFKNNATAMLAGIVALASTGLIENSATMFRMETMVILFNMAAAYCAYKFVTTRNKPWMIAGALLLGGALATKQMTYVILPLFILLFLIPQKDMFKVRLKNLVIFLGIGLAVAAPALINEFRGSGTLFYPGVPFVGPIEEAVSKVTGVNLHVLGDGWKQYAIGSDRSTNNNERYHQLPNHLLFVSPFDGTVADASVQIAFVLLALGIIALLYYKQYFLLIFGVLHAIMLSKFPLDRYFLLNQILAAIAVAAGGSILFLTDIGKRFKYIGIALFIVVLGFSVVNLAKVTASSLTIPDYSYGRYIPNNLHSMIVASNWIAKNTPKDSVIITPRTSDISYYVQRDCLWLNQIGGKDIYEAFLKNDTAAIRTIAKKYPHAYILLPKFWILEATTEKAWISFIQQSSVDAIDQKGDYFSKVYDTSQVVIYKVHL